MSCNNPQQEQAAQCVTRAERSNQAGAWPEAIGFWRQAVLLYAEACRTAETEQSSTATLLRARAHACRGYGETLTRLEQHPEAANVFQEAADLYGQLSQPEDRQAARECARHVLASVAALRANPQDRLYLLVARYTRQQQQLAMQPGTFAQQADCCLHIAQIFLRRARPTEARTQFDQALQLYGHAEPTDTTLLAQAECHHRLGNLLANVLIDEPNGARKALAHYDAAIALYGGFDPDVQNVQEDRALCTYARADLARRLEK